MAELEGVSHALRVMVEERNRELTERRRAEAEVRALNLELESRVKCRTRELAMANRELEAFSSAVSHDLRSPLQRIQGFAQIVSEDYATVLPDDGRDFVNRIASESRRMAILVDALFQLSQATHGALRRDKVDLSRFASQVADDLRRQQPGRSVEFVIAPGLVANGDPALLRSVLQNLLDNAWKFTARKQQAKVEFGVTGGDHSAYFVRDNGAGFESSRAGEVFVPFQRLHSLQEFPGTGVGLATVRQIISRHGGHIWAAARRTKARRFSSPCHENKSSSG